MLEERQTKVAAAIEARRDAVSRVRGQLVDRRDAFAAVRSDKATALASTRETRQHLEGDLAALEAANAKVQSQIAAAQNGTAPGAAGPIRPGSGGLVWPVNGPIVSPFGMRWGRLHAGVDIAVAGRHADPRRAVGQGHPHGLDRRLRQLHLHRPRQRAVHLLRAPVELRDVQRRERQSQGQVIGSVGCTGHCFGDHLHFETRVGGAPVNPAGYL